VVEHEENPKEDATVETGRALNKWHANWNLALGCREKPKEWTQGKGGCQKKLAAARRGMTQCAGVAGCKGHCHQGHSRENAAPRTQKEREDMLKDQECKYGIRNRGLR
jgi:hypothetical protein